MAQPIEMLVNLILDTAGFDKQIKDVQKKVQDATKSSLSGDANASRRSGSKGGGASGETALETVSKNQQAIEQTTGGKRVVQSTQKSSRSGDKSGKGSGGGLGGAKGVAEGVLMGKMIRESVYSAGRGAQAIASWGRNRITSQERDLVVAQGAAALASAAIGAKAGPTAGMIANQMFNTAIEASPLRDQADLAKSTKGMVNDYAQSLISQGITPSRERLEKFASRLVEKDKNGNITGGLVYEQMMAEKTATDVASKIIPTAGGTSFDINKFNRRMTEEAKLTKAQMEGKYVDSGNGTNARQ